MTKITEELAATARWISDPRTAKRCKKNENSVLFTYTNGGDMIIAGMVGKGDVEPLTKHIIKTLMKPLDKKSKQKYIMYMIGTLIDISMDLDGDNEEDDDE
ncbi:MAG: hypothetical protein J5864_06310 [Oscillospiraceae bacterium]|nr:hypothetical protein [Oscillospiraceae bacterium]